MFDIVHHFRRVMTARLRRPQPKTYLRLRLDALEQREAPGDLLLGGVFLSRLAAPEWAVQQSANGFRFPGRAAVGTTPPASPVAPLSQLQASFGVVSDPATTVPDTVAGSMWMPTNQTGTNPTISSGFRSTGAHLPVFTPWSGSPAQLHGNSPPLVTATTPTRDGTSVPGSAAVARPNTGHAASTGHRPATTSTTSAPADTADPTPEQTTKDEAKPEQKARGADRPVDLDALRNQLASAPVRTTHYYIANGQQIGLNVHPDRVAIGTTEPDAVVAVDGLEFVRRLNPTVAVYEAPGIGTDTGRAELEATPGVAFTVPVFTIPEYGAEAVVVTDVIVALKPGVTAEEFFTGNQQFSSYRPLLGTPDQFVATVAGGYGEAALEVANTLPQDERVAWAAPDFYQNWQKYFTPNDPRFASNLWHLNNTGQNGGLVDADIDAPEAWDVNQGGSSNIVVAIVDDGISNGIATHPDLLNWVNPGENPLDGIDDDGNGWTDDINGWNFVNNNNNSGHTDALDGHGTATAGLAAARGNNALGVTGVAYNSQVLSAKIFAGNSAATDSGIASALYYAAGRTANGLGTWDAADIISNSWGGGGQSTAIEAAITWATTNGRQGKGATVVFSSGNGGGPVSYPASLSATIPGVICVGAMGNNGLRSSYSAYGTSLDMVAPSNGGSLAIDTTDRVGSAGYSPDDYTGTGSTGFGGTSASAPIVAGVGALVLAQADALGVNINPTQLRGLLRNSTELIGGVSYDPATGKNLEYGYGLVNAFAAVSGVGKAEISVLSPTADLVSGSSVVDIGSVVVGTSNQITLRVRNQGTSALNLTGLSVASGPFTISSPLGATTLNVGESTTFTLKFTPTTGGQVDRTVTITSNDTNEASFTFTIRGTGVVPSISGTVFEDWDGDGNRDANDPGLAGRQVYLDGNNNGVQDTATQTFYLNTPTPIPDNATPVFSDVTIAGLSGPITEVEVELYLTHPNVEDLDVFLISPNNTRIELFTDVGSTGDNFFGTILDDDATTSITAGSAPFTGPFRPEGLLSSFDGEAGNGTWRLEMTDDTGGNVGSLDSWSLKVSTATNTFTNPTDVPILPDGNFHYSDIVVSGLTGEVTDVNVALNITHTWDEDLVAFLISPDNEFIQLFGYVGSDGDNFTNTVLDDEAATPITSGSAPFTGSFRPVEPLSTFDGGVPNGTWTLAIIDTYPALDNGTLLDWSLILSTGDTVTVNPPTLIPDDGSTLFSNITIASTTYPSVVDVNVEVDILHTWDEDLDVFLISPNGTRVELFTDVGGSGDNFVNTVLDDEAATPITSGSAPFTGTFKPEGSLSAFDYGPAAGTWRLEITDDTGSDVGNLLNWSLTLTTAEQTTLTNAEGFYAFVGLPNNTYTVRRLLPSGWTNTGASSHTVTITSSSDTFPGKNFSEGKNNRFYGYVYDDADLDGIQDPGEGPVAGRTLYHDVNTNGAFNPPGTTTISSGTINLAIPDFPGGPVTSNLAVSGLPASIDDVNVRVNINHTWDADLDVFLISPAGTRVELFTDVGGSGDNFVNTVLDDEAATAITAGTAPFTGTFRPEGLLSAVDGQDGNGTWTLEITDDASADTGTLVSWDLFITTQGEASVVTDALGNGYLDLPAGAQQVRMLPLAGWVFTNPADGKRDVTAAGAPLFNQTFGTTQPPVPVAPQVLINGTTTPSASYTASRITSLVLTFNTPVTVETGAFSLSNGTFTLTNGGGGISVAGGGTNTLTLTFTGTSGVDFGSLADGIWTLTTDLTKVKNVLNTAGTGSATTNHIRRLFGDVNGDGTVDGTDFADFGNAFGQSFGDAGFLAAVDFDANGTIDGTDYGEFGNRFGTSL